VAVTDTNNPDWDGYGDDWDDLSSKTLELDDYTCQRCFQDNGPLQAHHVEPRAQGGEDHINNLITVCRPCHGVQHPDNHVFDGSRPHAPLFPHADAPEAVAWLRRPEHHECDRCDAVSNDPSDIIAYRPDEDGPYTLCYPCAGVLVNQVPNAKHNLSAQHKLRLSALTDVADEADLMPTTGGPLDVYVKRSPQTPLEKLSVTIPFWPFLLRLLLICILIAAVVYLL
jgi:hypothetical protein